MSNAFALSDLRRALLFGGSGALGALLGNLAADGILSNESRESLIESILFVSCRIALIGCGIAGGIISCEGYNLQRALPSLTQLSRAMAGGLFFGAISGAIPQLFFRMTTSQATTDDIIRVELLRILAWIICGALLGIGICRQLPNLPAVRALMGGALGGGLGGLAFSIASVTFGDFFARMIGTPLIGFGIGAMIAVADILLREAWLEIQYSPKESRRVSLGSRPVTIGSDRERCTVVIPNAPSIAAKYLLDQGKLTVEDGTLGRVEIVSPGDRRSIGNVHVVVCGTASSGTQPGPISSPPPNNVEFILVVGSQRWSLSAGTVLLPSNLPGCEPGTNQKSVAEVAAHPSQPGVFGLKNLTRHPWSARTAAGEIRTIEPGKSIRIEVGTQINFGKCQGAIQRT